MLLAKSSHSLAQDLRYQQTEAFTALASAHFLQGSLLFCQAQVCNLLLAMSCSFDPLPQRVTLWAVRTVTISCLQPQNIGVKEGSMRCIGRRACGSAVNPQWQASTSLAPAHSARLSTTGLTSPVTGNPAPERL